MNDEERSNTLTDQDLDRLLATFEEPEPSAALLKRVAEIPLRVEQHAARAWWPFESLARPLLGWAAALGVGLLFGITDAAPEVPWESGPSTAALSEEADGIEGDPGEDAEQWVAWALAQEVDEEAP